VKALTYLLENLADGIIVIFAAPDDPVAMLKIQIS
jgi:hypothetical protein